MKALRPRVHRFITGAAIATLTVTLLTAAPAQATPPSPDSYSKSIGAINVVPATQTFPDVPTTGPNRHQFANEITWLVNTGITTGYSDGTFRPAPAVERQAMAAFLYRFDTGVTWPAPYDSTFRDITSNNNNFFREITWLASTRITTGFADNTFRPRASIERGAMAAFMYRMHLAAGGSAFPEPANPRFSDVPTGHQFYRQIEWLASTNITTGYADGTFRPRGSVQRSAMAAFLQRFDAYVYGGTQANAPTDTPTGSFGAHAQSFNTSTLRASIDFGWPAVGGATSYRLRVSRTSAGDMPVVFNVGGLQQRRITGLRPGASYWVQLQAMSGSNVLSSSSWVRVNTAAIPSLNIASYNIGGRANWSTGSNRAPRIVSMIQSRRPDVIGLQEASQNPLPGQSNTQGATRYYDDLLTRLNNASGPDYNLVNREPYNCNTSAGGGPWSPAHWGMSSRRCHGSQYDASIGASRDLRIAYNPQTVQLIPGRHGSVLLDPLSMAQGNNSEGGFDERYLVWAEFEQISTGKRFFFANTHLGPGNTNAAATRRNNQRTQLLTAIDNRNMSNLPVVLVGDFNEFPWSSGERWNNLFNPIRNAGYTDVLGIQSGTSVRRNTGLRTVYAGFPNCDTANNNYRRNYVLARNVPGTASKCWWESYSSNDRNGNNIDYIFVRGINRVPVWETVMWMNGTGTMAGTIPSDHNMIRAEIVLP